MIALARLALVALTLFGCATARELPCHRRGAATFHEQQPPVDAFEAASETVAGRRISYRLLRPRNVEPGRRYPLVVIFHGSGAIGTDNRAQIGPVALSWATPEARERYDTFVLVPQFAVRSAEYTNAGTAEATSRATDALRDTLTLIDRMVERLPVDRTRVYAIGFSMGGSAIWNALLLRPGLFSAAAIVAGVPNRDALPHLGATRLLLVHGDADNDNPYSAAIAAYERASHPRVEFWRFCGLAHEFPLDLVTEPRLAEWLFRTSN